MNKITRGILIFVFSLELITLVPMTLSPKIVTATISAENDIGVNSQKEKYQNACRT